MIPVENINNLFTTINKINVPLILFGIIIFFYLWYVFSILYHLIRFGIGTHPKMIALIFFVGSIILVAICFITYFSISWADLINQISNLINQFSYDQN
ncbi:MAG: hypothetical protein NTW73_00995 [Candidatus Parcubacteria bacterium]|nr:hypothetical protein [Candidatus Parcubacteria bacterium]